ncbi:MAG: DnaA/Hda family protein [Planctomycetota bacterium]|uniref:DnaA/Hda family protein n=1 Tax=uncultured Gimesia sp. TaxID=1678688 RepID=UPI00261D5D7D|nr:DnaA/Hda family protein [uncultured Gimesia sp.]
MTQQELNPSQRVIAYLTNPRGDRLHPKGVAHANWWKVSDHMAEALVEALIHQKWPVVLVGKVGLGKSCAMACIYRGWRKHALWRNSGDLLSRVMDCRFSRTKSITVPRPDGGTLEEFEQSIYRKIQGADLLCLDDVGVKAPTEAQREVFNNIIDLRNGKPTVLTTNLDHDQFTEVFDDRTFSRVFSGTVIRVQAKDRRFEGTKVINVKEDQ